MTFSDILKQSFLEGYSTIELSATQIIIVLMLTSLLSIYIFFCYRVLVRRTFYSKSFNISLVAMALITASIILAVQSSVVISLGMVGALSIIRFRTAIKDPMDLIFLFWATGVGIICGAGLVEIAIVVSLFVTVFIFALDRLPVAKAPKILVINSADAKEIDDEIQCIIAKYAKDFKEKTRCFSEGKLDLVYEMRVKDGRQMVRELNKLEGIVYVSLLSHDGEVTF